LEASATRDWGYALLLLAMLSAFFLGLRLYGQGFVSIEFEILVIHVPAVICLLVYIATRRFESHSSADGEPPQGRADYAKHLETDRAASLLHHWKASSDSGK
jgi:hypothetical protein